MGGPGRAHHKDAVGGKGLLAGGVRQEGIVPHAQTADELQVVDFSVEGVDLAEQTGRLVGGGAGADDVAVLDVGQGLFHRNQLGRVLGTILFVHNGFSFIINSFYVFYYNPNHPFLKYP